MSEHLRRRGILETQYEAGVCTQIFSAQFGHLRTVSTLPLSSSSQTGPSHPLLQGGDPGVEARDGEKGSELGWWKLLSWKNGKAHSGPDKLLPLSPTVNCAPITGLTETDTQPCSTIKHSQASHGGRRLWVYLKMLGGNFLMSPPPSRRLCSSCHHT